MSVAAALMMMWLPAPQPVYPFDRSIRCLMHDADGALVATWEGQVLAVESDLPGDRRSLFQLQIGTDYDTHRPMAIPQGYPIPHGEKRFSASISQLDIDEDGIPIPASPDRPAPTLVYEFEMLADSSFRVDYWLAYLGTPYGPIAAGICKLRLDQQPNSEKTEAAE